MRKEIFVADVIRLWEILEGWKEKCNEEAEESKSRKKGMREDRRKGIGVDTRNRENRENYRTWVDRIIQRYQHHPDMKYEIYFSVIYFQPQIIL